MEAPTRRPEIWAGKIFRERLSPPAQAWLTIFLFSTLYFTGTLIRASEKRFWFDELLTFYICRLPTFGESWAAVLHGADYNPPLFYLIHRANAALFGQGLITMRLPEIFAFWICCLCLFHVVRKRSGVLAGFAAMALPVVSGAYYYAYEARPHGLVIGFAGVAVLCWSEHLEDPSRKAWLLGLALSFEAAFLIHCYAILVLIPFVLVELFRTVYLRRIHWGLWLAMGIPAMVAVASFIPLLRSFRKNLHGTAFTLAFPPAIWQFTSFYKFLFEPCILLFLLILFLFCIERGGSLLRRGSLSGRGDVYGWLLLLSLGFAGMPAYGIALGKAVQGPFFARYCITAAIGVGIALGLGLDRRERSRSTLLISGLVAVLLVAGVAKVVWHRVRGAGEQLIEPSVSYAMNTDPGNDLANFKLLKEVPESLPIATPAILDYLYLVHYWPAANSRLYQIVSSTTSAEYLTTAPVLEWCHIKSNRESTYSEFFRSHSDFILFSPAGYSPLLTELAADGAQIRSIKFDNFGHFIARIHLKEAHAS